MIRILIILLVLVSAACRAEWFYKDGVAVEIDWLYDDGPKEYDNARAFLVVSNELILITTSPENSLEPDYELCETRRNISQNEPEPVVMYVNDQPIKFLITNPCLGGREVASEEGREFIISELKKSKKVRFDDYEFSTSGFPAVYKKVIGTKQAI